MRVPYGDVHHNSCGAISKMGTTCLRQVIDKLQVSFLMHNNK